MRHPSAVIREWPAAERPRERLLEVGPAALSVRELLAILIGSGLAGRTAVDVAESVFRAVLMGPGAAGRLPVPDAARPGAVAAGAAEDPLAPMNTRSQRLQSAKGY